MTFSDSLASFGTRTALVLPDGSRVTYAALAVQADEAAVTVMGDTSKQQLLAIECDNSLASLVGYLGALRSKVPALLIEAGLAPELKDRLYRRFGVSSVWTTEGIRVDTGFDAPPVSPQIALMLSTSGSTGTPKLVRLSLGNLQANATAIAQYLSLDETERAITMLPIHYSYGLSVINSHLSVGASVALTNEPITSRAFWTQFRESEVTSIAGVPAIYSMLKQLRFERMSLPSLRTMTQAGGRLPLDLVRTFGELAAARGQRFFVMYGQTEATARMSYVPAERLLDKAGSIGIPIPGGTMKLLADDGRCIDTHDTVGEIIYTGPNVMLGYANGADDLAMPDTQRGELRTGDLAYRDADGFYYVVGRRSRFIKIFGKRYALDDLEIQMRELGFDVAMTGRDDMLVAALCGGTSTQVDTLQRVLVERYALHHSTLRVAAIDAFPMSSSGKLQYSAILQSLSPDATEDATSAMQSDN